MSKQKRGALTPDECTRKAAALIAEHGICLFIVDVIGSRAYEGDDAVRMYQTFMRFAQEMNSEFSASMPVNNLAVGKARTEKGFSFFLGDATWAGINDASVIQKMIDAKNERFPDLNLYYGVAADGWSDGIELIK